MNTFLDVVTAVCVLAGAVITLVAAYGVVILRDARTAMHAASKPATLGILLCATGAAVQLDNVSAISKLIFVVIIQFVTAPVGAHMLSRGIGSDADPSDDSYN